MTAIFVAACNNSGNLVLIFVEGNGWFRFKAFECILDATGGKTKVIHGLLLNSDGGYFRWPSYFAFPTKMGTPGSASMNWSGMLESVRKKLYAYSGSSRSDSPFSTCLIK